VGAQKNIHDLDKKYFYNLISKHWRNTCYQWMQIVVASLSKYALMVPSISSLVFFPSTFIKTNFASQEQLQAFKQGLPTFDNL
jgi:hypothetical protein